MEGLFSNCSKCFQKRYSETLRHSKKRHPKTFNKATVKTQTYFLRSTNKIPLLENNDETRFFKT